MPDPLLISNSDISGVLKRIYENFRVKSFPIATKTLAQIQKGKGGGPKRMRWGGDGIYWDVVLGRPVGYTPSSSGYFGKSSAAMEKQATLGIFRTYVTREIDRLAAMGTESKEAAFVALGRKIVEEALAAAKLGQSETLHGTGTGVKALVGSVTSTTVIVVTSPYGVASAGQGGLLIGIGDYIAVLDTSSSDAVLGRAVVTAVANSGDNATLTLDTAIAGMAATDKVVPCTASDTGYNAVPNGLQNSLNLGGSYASVCGLSSATYARWNTSRLVAGTDTADAAQPDEMDVWELVARVAGVSGFDAKERPGDFLLLTTVGLEKKLAQSFLGQRVYDSQNMMEIKGGFKAINIAGIPLISDFWVPSGVVYLIHLPSMTWVDLLDWQKVQFEDSGAWRFIDGRDAFQVNFGSYWNFGPLQRNSHGAITGYTDTARYSHVM